MKYLRLLLIAFGEILLVGCFSSDSDAAKAKSGASKGGRLAALIYSILVAVKVVVSRPQGLAPRFKSATELE